MGLEETSTFIKALTKSPQLKVLSILVEKPNEELTKSQIAQKAGIGRTTLYRVWEDLEKMKAIVPTKQVGAVTLYRINLESSVVQSVLNIKQQLEKVENALTKIDEIKYVEEFAKNKYGEKIPESVNILIKLYEMKALSMDEAVSLEKLKLQKNEVETLGSLEKAGLVEKKNNKLYLTPLGLITAKGATQIWKQKERETLDQALSSLKVAIDIINQEIKNMKAKIKK
jgi:Fe2+ or Zn2+ uptake regulation protein